MSILVVLVPLATLLALAAVAAFVWGTRNGQLDDLTTPAARILFDDEPAADQRTELLHRRGAGTPSSPNATASETPDAP